VAAVLARERLGLGCVGVVDLDVVAALGQLLDVDAARPSRADDEVSHLVALQW